MVGVSLSLVIPPPGIEAVTAMATAVRAYMPQAWGKKRGN